MAVLASGLRSELERAVGVGRGVAERAAAGVLTRLGVVEALVPAYLSEPERELRRGLRARARQLGDSVSGAVGSGLPLLVAEVAYEQWHRILFARFLEANGLLMHPEFGASVTLEECGEFAAGLGEPDAWSVAARFASEILPGIFRPGDPSVRVRLAPEDLLALERVVAGLSEETFLAEDSLGWVYQFWQSKQKRAVNDSGRKIGGADLSPVTQLFTEDYMVRFLLENSLGAWWAGKHPESPLLARYEFLRFDDGMPAAGTFEGWPDRVAAVTVMDPCCGSGHFLVAAFGMLWRMRAEEEGLSPAAAQDAVLRDNLFGLELDARCTQLAMFALALEAWKQGGYRTLPVPNVACTGIPAKAPLSEWTKLAKGDYKLEAALTRLHELFKDADTLGSLIDPIRAAEQAGLESVDWDTVSPLLIAALEGEAGKSGDPAVEVFGHAAAGIARAARLLSDKYILIATNPPYLGADGMAEDLVGFLSQNYPESAADLATAFIERCLEMTHHGSVLIVSPMGWIFLHSFRKLRAKLLAGSVWNLLVPLGEGAFEMITGNVVQTVLLCFTRPASTLGSTVFVDARDSTAAPEKARFIASGKFQSFQPQVMQKESDRILALGGSETPHLGNFATAWQGLVTGDVSRYLSRFWEVRLDGKIWAPIVAAPERTDLYSGRSFVLRYEQGIGSLIGHSRAHNFNPSEVRGSRGVLVGQSSLKVSLYCGEFFNDASSPMIPFDSNDLLPLWAYLSSPEFAPLVRRINSKVVVSPGYLVKVPFDLERWRAVAAEKYPQGLPQPISDDPTQWLFKGVPASSREPLQVAVARLTGFRWPGQQPDLVDALVDNDGIVCLPAVSGEQGAAERVRAVLAASFGSDWSNARMDELLIAAGGKAGDLEGWLRDRYFKHHTKVFQNRPFVWQVWDGRADGFSALVNYHRLTRQTLEKLTYTTLGWWIDRQRADARADIAGAAARLAAAEALQAKLALILEGEPPFDIYVRWKSLSEQPIGWEPDLDDGVRMNVRPFVEARVLRSTFTVNWRKDGGSNPDGSERHNDLHFTREQKEEAQ